MGHKLNHARDSRKCERPTKSTAPRTHGGALAAHVPTQHVAHVDAVRSPFYDGFFAAITRAGGFSNKEIQYDLRVSATLVDLWKSGERTDPFTRAREAVESFRNKGRADLIPSILIFIAGGFDGAVLSAEQFEALKVLTKVVTK